MATLTIRNLADEEVAAFRVRAAKNGRSMEAEARELIRAAVSPPSNDERKDGPVVRRLYEEELPPLDPEIEARVKAVQDEIRAKFGGRMPTGRVDALIAERRAAAERGE